MSSRERRKAGQDPNPTLRNAAGEVIDGDQEVAGPSPEAEEEVSVRMPLADMKEILRRLSEAEQVLSRMESGARAISRAAPPTAPAPEVTSSAASTLRHAEARDELHRRIERDFRYHAPTGPAQTEKYQRIRAKARAYAHELIELCPPSRELSRSLSFLEDAVHAANASVARHG